MTAINIYYLLLGVVAGYAWRCTRKPRRLRDPKLTLLLDGRRFVPAARRNYE